MARLKALLVPLSYIVDWLIIIIAAAVASVIGNITPNKRPFALSDLDISFPHTDETISSTLLIVCSIAIPAAIILVVALLLPAPATPGAVSRASVWKRKLWEWHVGWLSLALSLVSAWVITSCSKNLFGKPRPDLLARCNPDRDNITAFAVGGFADVAEGVLLVSADICRSNDSSVLNDGFRSFPSGHSSFSAAGLVYLSLFLASKFAVAPPFLDLWNQGQGASAKAFAPAGVRGAHRHQTTESTMGLTTSKDDADDGVVDRDPDIVEARNQGAAPPVYLLLLTAIPTFAAIYIASTRWSDFRHHGFDIIVGFLIGTITAYFAFRCYHLPISRGAGRSWGPRRGKKSFWPGVSVGTYASSRENLITKPVHVQERFPSSPHGDIEMGNMEPVQQ